MLASLSVAALAKANAQIASLEVELRASQKAYDATAAAKANAEKSQKSALSKAKKAEKLLLMPTKSMLSESKPWQSVFTQCLLLLKLSALPCLLFLTSVALLYLLTLFFSFFLLSAFYCAGFIKVSPSSLQPDDDPLMTAVNLLEAN
jgi:hypothetical protein